MGLTPFNPHDFPDCLAAFLGNGFDVQKNVSRQILLTIFGGVIWKNPRTDISANYPLPGRPWPIPVKPTVIVDWYGVYHNYIRTDTTITETAYQLISLFCRKAQECKPDLIWNVPAQKFYGDPLTQKFTDYGWEREERFWFTGPYDWPLP